MGGRAKQVPFVKFRVHAGIPQALEFKAFEGSRAFPEFSPPQYGWGRFFFQKWFRRGSLRAGHGIPSSTGGTSEKDHKCAQLQTIAPELQRVALRPHLRAPVWTFSNHMQGALNFRLIRKSILDNFMQTPLFSTQRAQRSSKNRDLDRD